VPEVRDTDYAVAVICSDLHLSMTAPTYRDISPQGWFDEMAETLSTLRTVASGLDCPILCAGDVFDTWGPPPLLINFALDSLPPMIAVPGQHDLPNHRLKLLEKSAFTTMVKSNRIRYAEPGKVLRAGRLAVYGFPWGVPVTPPPIVERHVIPVALIHKYIHVPGAAHPKATRKESAKSISVAYRGMSYASYIHGDNHMPFRTLTARKGGANIINPGALFKRKIDEAAHDSSIAILFASGRVEMIPIKAADIGNYKRKEKKNRELDKADFSQFLSSLDASPCSVDFRETVRHYTAATNLTAGAKQILLESIDPNTKGAV